MSKRKPATATKRGPKRAAQRANQAIVRGPKDSHLRSVAAALTESPHEHHEDSKQEAPLVEDPATASAGNPATALQDCKQTTRDIDSKQGIDFPSTTANVRAYQAKLLELTQANMQSAFEFAAKLAAIRSPVEILGVIVEFTNKRIAMFQKFSIEMAELGTKG